MCSFFSREKKAVLSLFHTFSLHFFSALFLSFFQYTLENERETERERESFLSSFGEEGGGIIRCALSLSLCFSLSRCDAYRSDRRECRPRERREKATAASTSEI